MRRLMLVLPLALLVMAPTAVRAAAGDLLVCDAPPSGTTVVGPNDSSTIAVPSPARLPQRGTTERHYQLDLYPATATNKASINSTLNWQIIANDWDLILVDDASGEEIFSEGFQPFDPATENVGLTLKHCSLFTLKVLNFNAVQADAIDPLQLSLTTGSVK